MLTACGIETRRSSRAFNSSERCWLQQCLPLAVLKPLPHALITSLFKGCNSAYRLRYWNFHAIWHRFIDCFELQQCLPLAVLKHFSNECQQPIVAVLQQCLPLAVLKLVRTGRKSFRLGTRLQQCLPLAVLKQSYVATVNLPSAVATVLTACGIETCHLLDTFIHYLIVATVLTACGIETPYTSTEIDGTYRVATVLTACGIETKPCPSK